MSYKLTNTNQIIRIEDGACIPLAPGNGDYQAYQAWLAEGNTPIPADVPDPNTAIKTMIARIEASTGIPRLVREFLLEAARDFAERAAEKLTAAGQPTTGEQLLSQNIGYIKAMEIEAQIQALRDQLV